MNVRVRVPPVSAGEIGINGLPDDRWRQLGGGQQAAAAIGGRRHIRRQAASGKGKGQTGRGVDDQVWFQAAD